MYRLFFTVSLLCFLFDATAQQNKTDSLKKLLDNHKVEDSNRIILLTQYAYTLVFTKPKNIKPYTDEALALSRKLNWMRGVAKSLTIKGLAAYYGEQQQGEAMDCYQQGIKSCPSYDLETLFNLYAAIGTLYYNQKQLNASLDNFQTAYTISNKWGKHDGEESLLMNMGNVYYDMHKKDTAIQYFERSLTLSREKKNLLTQCNVLNSLGNVYLEKQSFDTAYNYVRESLAICDETGNTLIKAYGLVTMAWIKGYSGDIDSAIVYARQGLATAEAANNMQYRRQAYEALSELYAEKKMYMEAYSATRMFAILNDSILSDQSKQQAVRIEMKYEQEKKTAEQQAEINKEKAFKKMIAVIAGVLLLAALVSFIFYKKRRDAKQKQQEAEFKTEVSETEMKALRSQMNPHFIFNSLNSIGDYISKNNVQEADRYLSKFAKLMRMILENSEQKDVPIADDLKALELYMQLESLRMKNKFSYEIKVDEDIDTEATLIPPLILQPFVENSIWHGLAQKEGDGKISIHIKRENNNMINCIVEDNGIGRKKSAAIKTTTPKMEKTSLGMKITQARIDILNKIKNSNAAVKLSDLEQGVRVEVMLPLATSF